MNKTMDCRTARSQLESFQPSPPEQASAEYSAALAHVETCPSCGAVVKMTDNWDQHVAQAMQSVPIPAGLRERLIENLEPSGDDGAPTVAVSKAGIPRRTAIGIALSTLAAGVVVAVVAWPQADNQLTLAQVLSAAIDAEAPFDEGFAATLPESRWKRIIAAGPFGAGLESESGHVVAAYQLEVRQRRRPTITGWLLVVPSSRLSSVPESVSFTGGEVQYIRTPSSELATVAWTKGDVVYLCAVSSGANAIERLQRAFEVTAT